MEFEEYLKIGSGPVWLTEDTVELKSPNTAKTFFSVGYTETWRSPRINSQASIVHIVYINDLPLRIDSVSEPVLFADDTSVNFK